MAGFNPLYVPIRTINPGIELYSLGNLPASWQFFAGTTDGNIQVVANAAPPSTPYIGNPFSTNQPFAYYEDAFVANGNIPHRITGAVMPATTADAQPPTHVDGSAYISLVYNTRFSSDGGNSNMVIHFGVFILHNDTGQLTYVINHPSIGLNVLTVDTVGIIGDRWTTLAIEVYGSTINFYWSGEAATDADNLSGLESDLVLVRQVILPGHATFQGPPVYAGLTMGTTGSGAPDLRSGVTYLVMEELRGPSEDEPPIDDPGPSPPPPVPPGGEGTIIPWPEFSPWAPGDIEYIFEYSRYKNIRQLTFALNNLKWGP